MTISYSGADGYIHISGAETDVSLAAFLTANGYGTSNTASVIPTKPIFIDNNATLTVSKRQLLIDGAYRPSADGSPPIRANDTTNGRGKLVLRQGASLRVWGAGDCYSEKWPAADYEDSSVHSAFSNSACMGPNAVTRLVRSKYFASAGVGIDMHWAPAAGSEINGFELNGTGGLLLRGGDSNGLRLSGGCALYGDYTTGGDGATTVIHNNMQIASCYVSAHRASRWMIFYNLMDLSGVRQFGTAYGASGEQATSAAQAGRMAVVWLFNPTVLDAALAPVSGMRVRIAAAAGSAFSFDRSGTTGPSGVVPGVGFTWGYNTARQRTSTPLSGIYVLKSQTPEATAGAVGCQIIDTFNAIIRGYGYRPVNIQALTGFVDFTGSVPVLVDASCALSLAQASAVSTVTINWSTKAITISGDTTLDELYCRLSHQYAQPAQDDVTAEFSGSGTEALLPGFSITVASGVLRAGTLLKSLSCSLLTGPTSGVIYTDSAGTHVSISAPNLSAGTRVQVYNTSDSTEIYNGVLSGAGLSLPATWVADKTLRLRATKIGKLPLEATGVLSSSGLTFLSQMADDVVYTANAVDGAAVTEFAPDPPNRQVDITDGDGLTTPQRLYAWLQHYLTTSAGVASALFGGLTAADTANYAIDPAKVDLKLDNQSATPVHIVGGYLYRTDGTTVIAATSGSIQMDPGRAYTAPGSAAITVPAGERVITMQPSGGWVAHG